MSAEKKRRGRGEGSVEELPDGRWRAILSLGVVNGKRVRRKFYGKTKKEVLTKLRECQARQNAGTLTDAGKLTVGEWLEKWLELRKAKIEASTYRRYEQSVRHHLRDRLNRVHLGKFQPVHIEALYASMEKDGVSRDEQSRAGAILSRALREAVRLHLLPYNPAAEVKKPKTRKRQIHPLTQEQTLTFLHTAASDRLAAMYVFWLDSGCRPAEVYAMHWPSLDLDACTVRITRALSEVNGHLDLKEVKTPKGNRTIYLSRTTVAALRSHRERMRAAGFDVDAGPVFCDLDGGFLRQGNVHRRSFVPILTRAKIPKIRPYDLRHTCAATLLLNAGVNIKIVSERLGHASIQITLDHYAHVLPGMQQIAADAMEKIFSGDSPSIVPQPKNTVQKSNP